MLFRSYVPGAADPNSLLHAVGRAFLNTAPPPAPTATVQAAAGTPQTVVGGQVFPVALQARVIDADSHGLPGITVSFVAPASGASAAFNGAASVAAVTDASGVATAPPATANTIAGSYQVRATIAGSSTAAIFSLTNQPVPPAALKVTAVQGTPQTTRVRTDFPQRLRLTVIDAQSKPVRRVSVTFVTPKNSPSATFSTGGHRAVVTTDANGVALAPVLTANQQVGTFTVTATIDGIPTPVTYTLTNVRK